MKARELQIGDLLYYKGKFNAFPFKVESITKKKVGYYAEPNDHRMYYLRLSDCEPILLTPEILEKNGFKWLLRDSKYITYCIKESTIHVTKYKVTGEWLICAGASGSATKRFVEVSCVNYVHELQHALRLYGIKKEIV